MKNAYKRMLACSEEYLYKKNMTKETLSNCMNFIKFDAL